MEDPANPVAIVMLCGSSLSSRIMYNALASDARFRVALVVIERPPDGITLAKRRIKRLGFRRVVGQLGFIAFNKLRSRTQRSKIASLIAALGLSDDEIPDSVARRVETVNSQAVVRIIDEIKPDAVVVNGTRIISSDVLSGVKVPFINTHVGITPKYRGVHGAYWALVNRDEANVGVTVHLVDEGIDTGGILHQARIVVDKTDDFNTYPVRQIAAAIPLMKSALMDAAAGRLRFIKGVRPSRLWYHPTLYEYLKNRMRLGVK